MKGMTERRPWTRACTDSGLPNPDGRAYDAPLPTLFRHKQ